MISPISRLCNGCILYACQTYIDHFLVTRDLYQLHKAGEIYLFTGPRGYLDIASAEILEINREIKNLDNYLRDNYTGYGKIKLTNNMITNGNEAVSFLAHNTCTGFLISFCLCKPQGQFIHLKPAINPDPIWLELSDIRADLNTVRTLVKYIKPIFLREEI